MLKRGLRPLARNTNPFMLDYTQKLYNTFMSNTNNNRMISTYPIVRFIANKKTEPFLFIPEVSLLIATGLSYVFWPVSLNGFDKWLLFMLWIYVCGSLISLAVTNMRFMLLPDKMLKPLLYSVVFYVLTGAALAAQANSGSASDIIISSILGGLLLGGVPYILFQISSGKWIGGGDVKLGAIVGLLLGWKISLIALITYVLFTIFVFFIISIAQYSNSSKINRIPTGFIWALIAIGSFIFGNYFIK
jgi:leader peptidase (prepilin peptidase)/N-methyltransferase